eukprot:CAMPEP_0116873824 /NCGR_PEP_ID=MMETSP0463-20121206/5133_1 /TAXON_ID=181622 /ORGANISM="Strombidinopsis sp, Strain SopsisLIS2011" /LENGTH=41 /DNA_ID= /DNA_START= /DNA_END= /DNA_ORIENTATION=
MAAYLWSLLKDHDRVLKYATQCLNAFRATKDMKLIIFYISQ